MRLNFGYVVGAAVLVSAGLTACGTPDEDAAPEQQLAETEGQTLLASLTIAEGHRIEFYGYDEGGFSVSEVSRFGGREQLVLSENLKGLSPAQIYARLAPSGAQIPDSIRAIDLRFRAAAQTELERSQPPDVAAEAGKGPALYTDAEQTWFKNTFCTSSLNIYCIQGWDWAVSPWEEATWFRTVGYVNTGGSGTFTAYRWNGGAAFPVGVQYLNSNEWRSWLFTWSVPSWWKSELFLDTSSQLSVAIDAN